MDWGDLVMPVVNGAAGVVGSLFGGPSSTGPIRRKPMLAGAAPPTDYPLPPTTASQYAGLAPLDSEMSMDRRLAAIEALKQKYAYNGQQGG